MLESRSTSSTLCLSGGKFRPESGSRQNALVRIHPPDIFGALVELTEGTLTVGRDADCDIHLPDDSVSRQHARFEVLGNLCIVEDLGSTNGLYINDQRVTRQQLVPGDRVRFGNQIFRFLGGDRIEAEHYEAIFRMMTTDGLTQTCNKRYLLELLERELNRARRMGRAVSVVMFDVDHFKKINDQYGHLAGDEVLCELCHRARTVLRADEVLARFGGEEFTLVLAETSLENARKLGERLRLAIAERPFTVEGTEIPVTISVGIAEVSESDSVDAQELLGRADEQLYVAKRLGRNRVCA